MIDRILRALVAAGAAFAVIACGESATEPPPPPGPGDVTAISVSPSTGTAASLGETIQLTATATTSDGTVVANPGTTWQSDDDATASVSATGLVTAHANGTARVTASANGLSAEATITVAQVAALLTFGDPPADAEVDASLAPVRVEALDARDNVVADFTEEVTIALAANPGSGTLAGTTTVGAAAGVATFDDLSIDEAGEGYTLRASATGLTDATSGEFDINRPPETVTWVGGAGGTWSDGANWSTGSPPASVDLVEITADGTYAIVLDTDVTVGELTVGGGSGSQTLVVDAVALTVTGATSIAASGIISVEGGALSVTDIEIGGILSGAADATTTVTGDLVVTSDGSIRGVGTIDLSQATGQQVDGTIAPGFSPGKLNVVGNLVLGVASEIALEIGGLDPGVDFDQIVVTGTVTLSGTLAVTLLGGFTPPPGTTLPLLAWAAFNGGFLGTSLPPNTTAATGSSGMTLEVDEPPPAAWQHASADGFSCAVYDGQGACWGPGSFGRLGNGSTADRLIPTPVAGETEWVKIAAGADHACGLDADGRAHCWGRNTFGQVGDGTTDDRHTPVPVSGQHVFVDIGTGIFHSCGLLTDGRTLCWGNGGLGQFGDGRAGNEALTNPVPIVAALGKIAVAITVGTQHTCWLEADGVGSCAGNNSHGQIGGDLPGEFVPQPTTITGGHEFAQLSAGRLSTCGLDVDGAAHCWGDNANGGLGDGTTDPSTIPVAVIGGHTFEYISTAEAGWAYACALDAMGAARCWGGNFTGGLGTGSRDHTSAPTLVAGGHAFTHIDAGTGQSCGVDDSGGLLCWGSGQRNGDGTGENSFEPTPVDESGVGN